MCTCVWAYARMHSRFPIYRFSCYVSPLRMYVWIILINVCMYYAYKCILECVGIFSL